MLSVQSMHRICIHAGGMFMVSFIIRALVFIFLIQPGDRYNQPDTPSYHEAALSLSQGRGMYRADRQPIFWRTPGYPLYLAPFYSLYAPSGMQRPFDNYRTAHHVAIWVQIIFCSCIPILIFLLALLMSSDLGIALISGWFFVIHLGTVLASTFLLTEGIAMILFYSFLCMLFYQIIRATEWFDWSTIMCAFLLGAYTWIRPMGESIGVMSTVILIFFSPTSWLHSCKRAAFFLVLFALTLAPWYVRNYQLTQDYFFCPVSGIYFTCFNVPKILRRTDGISIEQAWKKSQQNAQMVCLGALQKCPPGVYLSPLSSKAAAMPVILAHPFWFALDWSKEVVKTTFDLFSYQLVTLLNGCFSWDPIEEFLTEKYAACLYTHGTLPLWARICAWLELCVMVACWASIAYGICVFVVMPLIQCTDQRFAFPRMSRVWWAAGILMAATVGMTGGFGYARLRLPIEPLIVILALIALQKLISALRSSSLSIS